MKTFIRHCPTCGTYTFLAACPGAACSTATVPALPPRYSPNDRWGKYRRAMNAGEAQLTKEE